MPAIHPPSLPPLLSAASSSRAPTPRPTPSPPLSSASSSPPPSSPTPTLSRAPSLQVLLPAQTFPSTDDPHPPCRDGAIGLCIAFAIPGFLGLVMVIFLAIPALMPPEFDMELESSLSSFNVSVSHVTTQWNLAFAVRNPSPIIAVHYSHAEIILRYDNRLTLSHTFIPTFTQPAGNRTTVQATVQSTLLVLNDMSVESLVNSLKGGQAVSIDLAVKAKRTLHVGPLNWVVFDVHACCSDVTFTAPPTGECGGGASEWMLLGGTASCTLDIFSQL